MLAHYVDLAETALACLTAVDTAELVNRCVASPSILATFACFHRRLCLPSVKASFFLSLRGLCCAARLCYLGGGGDEGVTALRGMHAFCFASDSVVWYRVMSSLCVKLRRVRLICSYYRDPLAERDM